MAKKLQVKPLVRRFRQLLQALCACTICRTRGWLGRLPICIRFRSYTRRMEIRMFDFCESGVGKSVRLIGPLLAIAAFILISLVIFEYFSVIYPRLMTVNGYLTAYSTTILGVFLGYSILFNHQMCVWTDPGFSSKNKFITMREAQAVFGEDAFLRNGHEPGFMIAMNEVSTRYGPFDPELKTHQTVRFCQKCEIVKPWRGHHCSVSGKCIMRMDHYCPWMWNCVGYYNYRYFYMFLFYLWIGTFFFIFNGYNDLLQQFSISHCWEPWYLPLISCRFRPIYNNKPRPKPASVNANDSITNALNAAGIVNYYREPEQLYLFTYFLCVGIFFTMCGFLGWHSYLLFTNQTTLECLGTWSEKARGYRRFQGLRTIPNIYRLDSILDNVKQVLGKRWWLALLPIPTKPMGNGLIYPLRSEVSAVVFRGVSSQVPSEELT